RRGRTRNNRAGRVMRALWVVAVVLSARLAAAEAAPLKQELEGDDDARAADAAQALGKGHDAQAGPPLVEALREGGPPRVQAAMLDALAKKKDARALEVLVLYARNRNAELRKKALAALTALNDGRAGAPLVAGLADSDVEVRAQAAAGIAQRRQKGAEEQ